MYHTIVNDIKNFVFDPAKAPVYGFGRNRKQKFVMSFTIYVSITAEKPAALPKFCNSYILPTASFLYAHIVSFLLYNFTYRKYGRTNHEKQIAFKI